MNADSSTPVADLDQPEIAFAAMSTKLAGLTAAIDGFAARQQEIHARDYGKDLANIELRQDAVREAVLKLAARPAMALTPTDIASQIEQAGAKGRAEDHAALSSAQRELGQAVRSINGMITSANTARKQKRWIAGAAAAAMVVGFLLGDVVPTWIDRAVPESWQWPERKAAGILQRNGWESGLQLLQTSDSTQWRALQEAARIARENADALTNCRTRAARAKKSVNCSIEVRGSAVD